MYIVEHYHSRRFWIDGEGWSTTDAAKATRFSRAEAYELAHHVHGQVVERERNARNEYPFHVPMHDAATLERAAQLCGGLTLS